MQNNTASGQEQTEGQGVHCESDHPQKQSNKPKGKQSNKPKSKQSNKAKGKRSNKAKGKRSNKAKGKRSNKAKGKRSNKAKGKRSNKAKAKRSNKPRSKRSNKPQSKRFNIPRRERLKKPMNELVKYSGVDESSSDSSLYSDDVVGPHNVQARNQEAPMHSNTTCKSEPIVDQNKTFDEAQKKRGLIPDNRSPEGDLGFSKLKQKQRSRVQKGNIEGHEASSMTRGSVGDPKVQLYKNLASPNVLKNENKKDAAKYSSKRESRRNKNKNKISKK